MNPTRSSLDAIFAASALVLASLLVGCGSLPDRPARATLYDFGPLLTAPAATPVDAAPLPTLSLAEVEASARLEGTQILYRLAYADANELRPYGQSRWSVAPNQLVYQRLRDALAERRTVLSREESATLARTGGRVPRTLRVSLDEFSHYFTAPTQSAGLVRLRATLVQSAPGGDSVVAQRSFMVQRPAPSADAPGGVRALTLASDAVIAELVAWVDQQP